MFVTSDSYYSLGNYSLEIFEDPSAMALVEVGILYTQRDPSFFRPISQGIKRCLAHPRTNEDELLELNQILVAENYQGFCCHSNVDENCGYLVAPSHKGRYFLLPSRRDVGGKNLGRLTV
ncbi:hypothetical protein DY000_02029964 [Brassica cretica]|uniref:Uncharacterized protein n=1 Tax=Brassica cretica TaxID=69181 RepID=A0ABQ7DZ51_BRACR|nr:hypothetical protein DY000_02029964 [Brassica cretica]